MTETKARSLLAVTAMGSDRGGVAGGLAAALSDSGCNVESCRMTALGDQFAVIALASGSWNQIAKLEAQIDDLSQRLGLVLQARRAAEAAGDTGTVPYRIEIVSPDRPGIVNELAHFLAKRRIAIEDMKAGSYRAPHGGTPMFAVDLVVGLPPGTHFSQLRDDFLDFCDDLNLDAVIEPLRA